MQPIKKQYIVDEKNRKVAVQIDVETVSRIETLLENYGLYQLMLENKDDKPLSRDDALAYYKTLDKAK